MLDGIDLDAIPSGETKAALLILAGRLQALTDQVTALTGNVSSAAPAPTPKRRVRKPAKSKGGE